ncbi:hypothetical protein [Phyllobacterium sp. OV277]|uniref:hypothetical protein n=1 Tax=Phyllobacterium sp. OV277 TaxID=1882772 RepID=UPI000882F351|nr:hypothetical protein [Phyllobacterium sp. OV277]SDP08860.1 hypothetical protein SAMN05443582_103369 [Phyllobacterium sp. OV277]
MVDTPRKNGKSTGKGKPPVEHQFKVGNTGRPKGTRNKLGEAFLEDLLAAWESKGPAVIHTVIEKRPQDFLKVVASLMPKDLNVNVNQMGEMTDEQLLDRIRKLDATIKPFLDAHGADGADGGDTTPTAH